jgi:hypothetical protein
LTVANLATFCVLFNIYIFMTICVLFIITYII